MNTKTKTITRKKLIDILSKRLDGIPNFIMDEIQGDKFTMEEIEDLENSFDYMADELTKAREALRDFLIQ
jgi:HAMP domain-containing protein